MVDPRDELAERRSDATREKIIEVAAERLAEHGYAATSLADVAMLAQLDQTMITFHFPAKEDLVEAVLRAGIDHAQLAIHRAVGDMPEASNGAERLAVAITAYLHAILDLRHVTRANIRCYRNVPPVLRRGLGIHMREFVETWTELFETGCADGSLRPDTDVQMMARVVIAALNSIVTGSEVDDIDHVASQLRVALLDGLATGA